MLGVYHLLHAMGKRRVFCVNEDRVPKDYLWLKGAEHFAAHWDPDHPVDVVVVLDVSRKARLGKVAQMLPAGARVVVLDHHLDDGSDGDVSYADPSYAAAGEIVAELFAVAEIPIPRKAAECLYVSIVTDTGGFRFGNTTALTHRIAADLLQTGINVAEISRRVFDVISPPKFELMRRVFQNMHRDMEGRLAYTILTREDMAQAFGEKEDLNGLVDFARNIEGVEVGILFREVADRSTKISVRSRGAVNCARFLTQFGGGGHSAAAGATLDMPLDDAVSLVLQNIRQVLPEGRPQQQDPSIVIGTGPGTHIN